MRKSRNGALPATGKRRTPAEKSNQSENPRADRRKLEGIYFVRR